ncbi:MAG: hypothetical protein M0T75_12685, partial [Chloroflexi bacterium]|nr:hypothetical protein [Chloroflexota bacterium]
PLPVALPPAGTYAATVSAAWAPAVRPGPARAATTVVDAAGGVAVRAHREPLRHDRLRVAFVRRAG